MNAKYRVWYTEYEAGWGSRPDGYRDFDTFEEAETHQKEFNSRNTAKTAPSWYMIAEDPILVDLDRNLK